MNKRKKEKWLDRVNRFLTEKENIISWYKEKKRDINERYHREDVE
jgi:hypothetical protein